MYVASKLKSILRLTGKYDYIEKIINDRPKNERTDDIRLVRAGRRNRDGYFLRAENFYNVASEVDRI